jgi:uncharacterized protein with HEPN domain
MDNKDLQIIDHMRRYCQNILASIERFGNSFDVFSNDTDFFQSVSMSLQQIGTLSGLLSDSFKDCTKERMPWGMMRNMRNRFAHTNELMDKEIIWDTAITDIANLLQFCEEIVPEAKETSNQIQTRTRMKP